MSDDALTRLARAAGLYVDWTDANGRPHAVKPDTLRAVLAVLGYPGDSTKEIAESHRRLEHDLKTIPRLITAHPREPVHLGAHQRARLRRGDDEWQDMTLNPLRVGGSCFRAPDAIGYYELELDNSEHVLAVAPQRCYGIADAAPGRRLAGLSVQIYSLRGGHSEGFGDFAALGDFAAQAGAHGIDAIAVSPTHARFAADPGGISPYSPSSRLFLDPLYADLAIAGGAMLQTGESADLIDWPEAHRNKYAQLRSAYETAVEQNQHSRAFRAFCLDGGQKLFDHALYEALDAHFRKEGRPSLRHWPTEYRDPKSSAVQAFAEAEKKEIAYHLFLQWLAAGSAQAAQARAKEHMAIGLIADMAVGMDRTGSHAWSAADDLLGNLSVGAPPDTFQPAGQNWGLTNLSPTALRATGYDSFIATLRASMQHAGGIRIDHAMGLRRLWVLPEGASPGDGVYLSYPFNDLVRLIALESALHRAIVIGEDLGTVPEGFRSQIAAAGILGMRVLWFERDREGRFLSPETWDVQAAALTTTHDLPTIAGWWRERDIDWSVKLRRKMRFGNARSERRDRKKDRALLWQACVHAGSARGPEPPLEKPEAAVEAAISYVSKTPSLLAIAATEDIVAEPEQPNIPGTVSQHPNWRRRLPAGDIWRDAKVRGRVEKLTGPRHR
ncbi:MAG TPA: 4-alpha-glucanotransferase [Rhizomicrobium sp.]